MHGFICIECQQQFQQLSRVGIGRLAKYLAVHAHPLAGAFLIAHIDSAGRILADEHCRQSRYWVTGFDPIAYFHRKLFVQAARRRLSIQYACRHWVFEYLQGIDAEPVKA